MDKILSYKRYASNLIVANIVLTCVWTVLAMSLIKTLTEDNAPFIVWSLVVVSAANVLSAYFGITGIIGRNSCQLTTYYILSEITIVSECFICLLIMLTQNPSLEQPVISTVQRAVAIIVLITQMWLVFETKNFQNLSKSMNFTGFDDFKARRMSSPPNICDIEKNSRVFSLTDQLLISASADSVANERHSCHQHNCYGHSSHSFGASQPVYQSSTTPIMDGSERSVANQWYFTSCTAYPSYDNNMFSKY